MVTDGKELVSLPVMTVPDLDLARIRRWADARVPAHAREQVRVEIEEDERAVTIVERRAPWSDDDPEWTRMPVARLRYTKTRSQWTLYWCDRNGQFHEYDTAPTTHVEELLAQIDRDPTGIFWG